jgi:hypothetical protein
MRRKLMFLALALTAAAVSLPTPRAEAASGYSCPRCVTYADGSQCCVSCWCNGSGVPVACTDNYCPPAGGEN